MRQIRHQNSRPILPKTKGRASLEFHEESFSLDEEKVSIHLSFTKGGTAYAMSEWTSCAYDKSEILWFFCFHVVIQFSYPIFHDFDFQIVLVKFKSVCWIPRSISAKLFIIWNRLSILFFTLSDVDFRGKSHIPTTEKHVVDKDNIVTFFFNREELACSATIVKPVYDIYTRVTCNTKIYKGTSPLMVSHYCVLQFLLYVHTNRVLS